MRNLCKNLFEVGDIMKLANKIGAHRKGGGCSADIYIYIYLQLVWNLKIIRTLGHRLLCKQISM